MSGGGKRPSEAKNGLCPEGWVQVEAHASFVMPLGFDTQLLADVMGELLGKVEDGPAVCVSSGCESACNECGCTRSRPCRLDCDPVGRPPYTCNTCLRRKESSRPLPLHRTEAGWPSCSTCDGGGCPDCTDPS